MAHLGLMKRVKQFCISLCCDLALEFVITDIGHRGVIGKGHWYE